MISPLARRGLSVLCAALLAGCDTIVLNPAGDIAAQQSKLIVVSTLLMLLIIVPVIVLIVLFAWRYRQSNTEAQYEPDWDHSTKLELLIWGAPLLIIIALGTLTWISTHTLDPYRNLSRIDAQRPLAPDHKAMLVEVVALDWKWLFIYPELGIATVNELVAPVDMPIRFKITASTVMNSFYIPALAGQIYAMPGMETTLNAVINHVGIYDGFSANYSGAGFSDMRFKFHGMNSENFAQWVATTKAKTPVLNRADYLQLEQPSIKDPVRHYGRVDADLYHAIVNRCVAEGQVCMDELMSHGMNMKSAQEAKGSVLLAQNQSNGRNVAAEICTTPAAKIGK
ncbi:MULTISPECIES: ubiquinol oxidase subunit II [unclassified Undibacterium]|uniref:ubiquinol oxidase subunit II n=1 Tax=unclassified Undibacterium TaxID=2630295 RepID=UPI002AC9B233|nr:MULTISPECIES: ubiquinol oxidase subunit II [unclassified Undibacterium]MEB0140233.1 ubiquinol oxidase subunit II [Undibacterium sp. CCC2.1]MEB0173228.1 ubiquinol oxidase subunit II [Undibacterium sp. CCC1.1]MEB0177083.1 ubiquinol oxidase subunit II [Undibacterium sp. CCC3.4]MEB0216336.1 ubiquinol oxidase subunit II [Undibacterium sp. 5I2]WPX45190.1 ubiquinol oxidase subunit II [Undibacterium sp. CCC3.4]